MGVRTMWRWRFKLNDVLVKYRFSYYARRRVHIRERVKAELTGGVWFGRVGFEGDKGMGGVEDV
jgi:hypothetical protein